MVPAPFEVAAQAAGHRRHLDARARRRSRRSRSRSRPASSRCSRPCGAGEVPISISGDPGRAGARSCTRSARSGWRREAICAAEPGDVLSVRGPFGRPWPVDAAEGADVVVVAGGIGLAPLRPAISAAARAPRALRPADAALRRALARTSSCSPTSSTAGRERGLEVEVTVDSAGPEWLGHVGVVTAARRRARARRRRARSRCRAGPR